MRVLIDTNVVLDVLQERQPFVEKAVAIFAMVERNELTGLLCATTLTTLAYLFAKAAGKQPAIKHLRELLVLFEVAPVTRAVLEGALASRTSDFEDAVLAHAALHASVDAIITRNLRDFANSPVRAYTPTQWLAMR